MNGEFLPLLLLRDGEAFRTRLRERRVAPEKMFVLEPFVRTFDSFPVRR